MKGFNVKIFVYSLIFIFPLFVNLNFSQGLNFNANPFNYLGAPSVPVSLIFFVFFAFINLLKIKLSKLDAIFLVAVVLYMLLNIFFVFNIRAILLGLGMLILVINKAMFSKMFVRYDYELLVKNFYFAISFVVIIKFISDLAIFGSIFSEYFLTTKIAIYNYYDYFSFIYLLCIAVSTYYLKNKKMLILSTINIIVCFCVLTMSHSRFFLAVGLLFIPAYIFVYKVPIKFKILYTFCVSLVISLTILIGISAYSPISDQSLVVRFDHWTRFIHSLTPLDLVFTFNNEYRQFMNWGTFHNEFLEIFSYYGICLILYIFVIYHKFKSTDRRISKETQIICLFLVLGTLIQLNLTNPYIVLLLSFYLSIVGKNKAQHGV